jgi:hypothetical protein
LTHTFLWEYSYKRLKLAQLLGRRRLSHLDPVGQPRVLFPARRHVAVAVRRLVRCQPRELRLPPRVAGVATVRRVPGEAQRR